MKRLFFLLIFLFTSSVCFGVEVPPLKSYVNDHASMLSPAVVQQLEQELASFEQSDSTQIVVLTIPSLEGEVLEQYSIKVVEQWKIGRKGKDNGALLLVVKNDRKIRIESGRGLEGTLTDLVSGRIIRNEISPAFKRGEFDLGVVRGVGAIMATVRGEYSAEPRDGSDIRHGKKGAPPILTLLLFVLVASVFLGGISKLLGGVAGAIGLPAAALVSYSVGSMIVLGVLAVAGFILGLIIAFLFSSGGRGGFMGGPFFGGGFGGGGFGRGGGGGGFMGGGGSFGGGGASGDW